MVNSASSENPLLFWRDNQSTYPILFQMASKVLALPASSAGSEKRFSIVGKVAKHTRSSLKASTESMLIAHP